tara:strand:+ start:10139 stop:13315 length:3177 start_codon:yes stop_codon:yes gene_type:complete
MAVSNTVFVSPGVYTSERDLSFVAQSVGVTTLGLVGETLTGPAFEPIFISGFDEFQSYFGGTNPTKFVNTQIPKYEAAYIAKAYLQQSNQLFVTRVLGLSGYDAGPSWSITTQANLDPSTLSVPTVSTWSVNFTGSTGSTTSVALGAFSLPISTYINDTITLYNGDSTTMLTQLQTSIHTTLLTNSLSATTVAQWGVVTDAVYNSYTGQGYTAITNSLSVDGLYDSVADYDDSLMDPWYYGCFEPGSGDNYSGMSFNAAITSLSGTATPGSFTGTVSGSVLTYTATAFTEYNDVVVATLRSRGNNSNSDGGPVYNVSGLTQVIMDCSGVYADVQKNPYSPFAISGITNNGGTFSFKTSFDLSDTNYLTKVFGSTNFGKTSSEFPLFVEETYYSLLTQGYRLGKVRGLNCDLIDLPSARNDGGNNTSIGWYLEQYQTPATPFLVSELRGSKVDRLFRFILISDGNAANNLVKVSLANMSFSNNTFDVIVRDYFDTDANPVIIEKFTNCTMSPGENGYVAKKIGTSNGEFELKSRYIMLDMDEDAPVDALPCGFEGYVMREYSGAKSPFVEYKTKYNTPGEVIYNPPFGTTTGGDNSTRSSGDKVRKTYLGISNTVGIDSDFFKYGGKQNPSNLSTATESSDWNYLTKGYHMDSGATVVTISGQYISSGTSAFDVGDASFTTDPTSQSNPYYKLNARKFTLLAKGGFDGWDIYRQFRTNQDTFRLGGTGYLAGAAPSVSFPTATGWGQFKQIAVGEDTTDWANSDYYAYLMGQKTFENPEAVNINIFVTPGIDYVNHSNLVEDAIDMIETDRADSIYICTTPDYNMFVPNTSSFDTDFIYPDESVDNLEETGIDSNYTATYYPWILTRDGVNNTQVYIPPTSEVVKNLALTDNVAFPWFATAGYTRGLVNSVKARKKLTQEDRDTLYQGRLNPIATFSDVGTVIWGNKTLQLRESALDRINVRRLLLQARKLISAVAVRLLFEQNDDQVRQDFLDSVNPILDSIRRDRGLIDFRVVVENTPEDLDNNTLTGKIYLKPTRALEFIDIEFLITPTGASFEDI